MMMLSVESIEWQSLSPVSSRWYSMRHLLAIDDLSDDLPRILEWAIAYKSLWTSGDELALNFLPLDLHAVGSIYEKPSTRTRISFEVGITRLGGQPLTLSKNDIQLGSSESVEDTARVLSRFLDGITYRCFAHADVEALASSSSVPVINALSDRHHPRQAAADLMTILELGRDPREERVAWVGDGNNVLHDLMLAASVLGIDLAYAVPEGYEPDAPVVERASALAAISGSTLRRTTKPKDAVQDATIVYTDVFISMGEEGLSDKASAFEGYQVNLDLLETADPEWRFMHCLPAHRGDEVTDEVMDHPQSIVFDQAENRMWAQMALMTYLINPSAYETMAEMLGV